MAAGSQQRTFWAHSKSFLFAALTGGGGTAAKLSNRMHCCTGPDWFKGMPLHDLADIWRPSQPGNSGVRMSGFTACPLPVP